MIDERTSTDIAITRPGTISWGAIIGGWVVAFSIAWLFYVAGLAIGFSAFDPDNTDAVTKGVGIGTTLWIALTWVVSLFLGGMFASWLDGRADDTVGTLHGVAVWGLAGTITVVMAAMGAGHVLQGGASLLGSAVSAGASATAGIAQGRGGNNGAMDRATGNLQAQLRAAVAQRAGRADAGATSAQPSAATSTPTSTPAAGATPTAPAAGSAGSPGASRFDRDSGSAVALDLLRGNTDDAKARLAADSGMQPADVDATLQAMAPQVDRMKAQLAEAADRARRYSAAALWAVFVASILSLIAAALGGYMGAGNVHRVHHTRRY